MAAARPPSQAGRTTTPEERAKALTRIGEGLAARMDEIATVITREAGMPKWLSSIVQAGLPINSFNTAAQLAETYEYESTLGNSLVGEGAGGRRRLHHAVELPAAPDRRQGRLRHRRRLHGGAQAQSRWRRSTPSSSPRSIDDAGLPAGVFNLVTGTGPGVGEAIAAHPEIDMVSFTGSTRAGKRVAEVASQTLKRVALELGGKSANVLLDDLDDAGFEKAVRDGVRKAYLNSGQTCTALTRMLVPTARLADAERIAADEVETKFQPKDPFADGAMLGPLSEPGPGRAGHRLHPEGHRRGRQARHRRARAARGRRPRGRLLRAAHGVLRGPQRHDHRPGGDLRAGPVDHRLRGRGRGRRIANDSLYGLSGGVWSADPERAKAFARRIRTGQIEVNGGAFNPSAPFGGYKNSGYGREYGPHGFEEFLEIKSMQL